MNNFLITRHLVKAFDIGVNFNLYGGRMMDWLDEAGALYALERFPNYQFVTLKISETIFHKPVHINEVLKFYIINEKIGNTSLTLTINVMRNSEKILSTNMVFVSIDSEGNKKAIKQ